MKPYSAGGYLDRGDGTVALGTLASGTGLSCDMGTLKDTLKNLKLWGRVRTAWAGSICCAVVDLFLTSPAALVIPPAGRAFSPRRPVPRRSFECRVSPGSS